VDFLRIGGVREHHRCTLPDLQMNGLSLIDALRRCWFYNPHDVRIKIDEFVRDPAQSCPVMHHSELGEIWGRWNTVYGRSDSDLVEEIYQWVQRDLMRPRGKKTLYFLIYKDILDSQAINPSTYEPFTIKKICIAEFLK
jgi:hypothetical protein